MTEIQKKKSQHYVWKYYMKAWANEKNLVACMRGDGIFTPNLDNINQENYFYKLSIIGEPTLELIKKMMSLSVGSNEKIVEDMVEDYIQIYREIKLLKFTNGDNHDESIDIALNNYIEEIHTDIENNSIEYIKKLRVENSIFYNTDEDRIKFDYFINLQYLRTNKIKINIENTLNDPVVKDRIGQLKEAWPLLQILYARIISASFSTQGYRCIILKASDDAEFITSDQPIINTKAEEKVETKGLEFYYPISPKISILLSKSIVENKIDLTTKEVENYNIMIVENSKDFLIASTKEKLIEYTS